MRIDRSLHRQMPLRSNGLNPILHFDAGNGSPFISQHSSEDRSGVGPAGLRIHHPPGIGGRYAAGYTTLKKTHAQLWADHYGQSYAIRQQPSWETERAAFNRAIFSKRQLVEVMADFSRLQRLLSQGDHRR
jgi:hypothetical protein